MYLISLLLVIIIVLVLIKLIHNSDNFIPKIIHQQGPRNRKKWHKIWKKSRPSWLKKFPQPEYRHIFWDNDMILELIKNEYPWLLEFYNNQRYDIIRYDLARIVMLHKYGGIYADLDFEIYTNFYDNLPQDQVSVVESPHKDNEEHQNSLMVSPPGHPFWIEMIKDIINNEIPQSVEWKYVLSAAGPIRLDRNIAQTKHPINVLPISKYNHWKKPYKKGYIGYHHSSSVWK
jgi:mannosyltransferase OCH1-like enzyme